MTRTLLIIALLFSTPAWAGEVLYCQTELSTGIYKENGKWVTGNFRKERYTVKFDEENMTLSGLSSSMKCKRQYKTVLPEMLFCNDSVTSEVFSFSEKSLRFSYYHIFGTAWVLDGRDTAVMSHGTCQKF